MSGEDAERLAVLETKVTHLEESFSEIKQAINELKPVVWKATGSALTLLILVELILKGLR
jgi:uncharacterized coiled-coil protein SlyX